jgi:hypothetical protein
MKHDSRETVDSFNFGDSPIVLEFGDDQPLITFGSDAWAVPAADLIELANGLQRLGYGYARP